MGDLRKNFNRSEFACSHCGLFIENDRLADTVQMIRDHTGGKAIRVISGTRCKVHNASKEVGGSSSSGHLTGESADIQVPGWSNKDLGVLIKQLYGMGKLPYLTYCYLIKGKTNTSVHVGVDVKKRSRIFAF